MVLKLRVSMTCRLLELLVCISAFENLIYVVVESHFAVSWYEIDL